MMNDAASGKPSLKRLPGRGWKIGLATSKRQRLYLAPDHLVVLNTDGYEERSKRFAFRDIQAITVQTNRRRAYQFGFSVFVATVLLATAANLAVSFPEAPYEFVLALLVFPVGILIFDLVSGPTATVRLHTAVQVEQLDALRRVRAAQKALDILLPRIRDAQGGGSEEFIAILTRESDAQMTADTVGSGAVTPTPRATSRPVLSAIPFDGPKRVMGRVVHGWAFGLTLLYGTSGLVDILFVHPVKSVVDALLILTVIVLLVVAAIRQYRSTLPRELQRYTWITLLGVSIVVFVVMYINMFAQMMTVSESGEPPPMFGAQFLHPSSYPNWFRWVLGIAGGINLTLGAFGLLLLRGYRVVTVSAEARTDRVES